MNLIAKLWTRVLVPVMVVATLSACASSGQNQEGGADFQEAARLNTMLGIDYLRKGENELAMSKLKRAISQDDKSPVAHSTLAYLYAREGEAKLAETHYRKALSLDSKNPDTRNNFGVFLCGNNRRDEGVKYLLQAAQDRRFGTPEAAWTNAGACVRSTEPAKAEQYFRNALKINEKFGDALAHMASISFRRADYLRTRAFLQRYEQNARHIPMTLWMAASTERRLGNLKAALRYENILREEFPEARPELEFSS